MGIYQASRPGAYLGPLAPPEALTVRSPLAPALFLVTVSGGLGAQTPPARLDWSADDSVRIALATAHGHAYRGAHSVVWAPADSLDPTWLAAFVDSLDVGLAHLEDLIGGPYPWQRIANRPVRFYLSPGRFVSHASGRDAVFISLRAVRQRYAPYLHEAAHELLAPAAPFSPWEYPDSAAEEAAAARFPVWLSEGLADYLAQTVAAATGFPEGDVFEIGGLAKADSVCAARLSGSPRRAEILDKVGGNGRLEALFTDERAQVAPVFYACSQSFTRYLADRIGVRTLVVLFSRVPSGAWLSDLAAAAGEPLDALRRAWLVGIGVEQVARD